MSITHHTRKRPPTGPRTTHGPHTSSEAETRSRGWVPRARRGLAWGEVEPSCEVESHPGGVKPSSEAGISCHGTWPSSETEIRQRGAGGRLFVGPLRLFGPSAFLCLGTRSCVVCFAACLFVYLFTFYRNGCFPLLIGDPYGCPRHMLAWLNYPWSGEGAYVWRVAFLQPRYLACS
jgi:hypothetical protein